MGINGAGKNLKINNIRLIRKQVHVELTPDEVIDSSAEKKAGIVYFSIAEVEKGIEDVAASKSFSYDVDDEDTTRMRDAINNFFDVNAAKTGMSDYGRSIVFGFTDSQKVKHTVAIYDYSIKKGQLEQVPGGLEIFMEGNSPDIPLEPRSVLKFSEVQKKMDLKVDDKIISPEGIYEKNLLGAFFDYLLVHDGRVRLTKNGQ